jgi:hypothetical protein
MRRKNQFPKNRETCHPDGRGRHLCRLCGFVHCACSRGSCTKLHKQPSRTGTHPCCQPQQTTTIYSKLGSFRKSAGNQAAPGASPASSFFRAPRRPATSQFQTDGAIASNGGLIASSAHPGFVHRNAQRASHKTRRTPRNPNKPIPLIRNWLRSVKSPSGPCNRSGKPRPDCAS